MGKAISSKWKWITIIIVALVIAAFFIYRMLFPGMVTDYVDNTVEDRATKDWSALEAEVPKNELRDVFFGDMHVHTSFSFDAYIGGILPKPADAYRFAKGESIKVFTDDVKIKRPLDFAAVTDHAEFLGELYSVHTKGAPGHNALLARYFRSLGMDTLKQREFFNRMLNRVSENETRGHLDFFQGFETTKAAWDINLAAAEEHYIPGDFTTFAAYEWTFTKGATRAHGHRNIFFKDMMVPQYPISAVEAPDEVQMWNGLEQFRSEGATVMAVPHNSNLSQGLTFPFVKPDGSPLDEEYMASRRKNEPLVEIHQAKGNSEVHPELWTEDEFAGFEVYNQKELNENNYVRHILKRGLQYKSEHGINPYAYGIIGSTDTHNGTPGNTEEDDEFKGNHAFVDYNAELRQRRPWVLDESLNTKDVYNPGGLMGVWAKANTRSEIYESMERKETFATSGGRIQVRFFGGHDLPPFSNYEDMVSKGYTEGVHMGESLIATDEAPSFYVWAAKDSEGARLDRIQIIKGWYDGDKLQEKIYNVAASDNRAIDEDGTISDIDSELDMKTGTWNTSVGASELSNVWTDPDYNSDHEAFYYVRVLEVETPRWSLYDQIQTDVEYKDDTQMTIRERAWSSPIWVEAN